jgi:hypothetical protein
VRRLDQRELKAPLTGRGRCQHKTRSVALTPEITV